MFPHFSTLITTFKYISNLITKPRYSIRKSHHLIRSYQNSILTFFLSIRHNQMRQKTSSKTKIILNLHKRNRLTYIEHKTIQTNPKHHNGTSWTATTEQTGVRLVGDRSKVLQGGEGGHDYGAEPPVGDSGHEGPFAAKPRRLWWNACPLCRTVTLSYSITRGGERRPHFARWVTQFFLRIWILLFLKCFIYREKFFFF